MLPLLPDGRVVLLRQYRAIVGAELWEAPAGTLIYIRDPQAERVGFAKQDGTVVLSLGATAGTAYEPSGWDTSFLEGS